jgi:hypothetical protein
MKRTSSLRTIQNGLIMRQALINGESAEVGTGRNLSDFTTLLANHDARAGLTRSPRAN